MRIVMLEPLGVSQENIASLSAALTAQGHEFIAYDSRVEDTQELIRRSEGADVLLLANLPLKGEVIRSVPNLKMISVAFTGIDHIDLEACREKGIRICNAAGYSTHSVAELAFGLMIAVYRHIVPCNTVTREGKTKMGLIGNELYGKTLGIVGTGAIGMRVAEIGKAFGCKILAYSRSQKQDARDLGITYVSLEKLLSSSDIVTLHTPLSPETKQLINKERIARMKSSAVLINTARGPVVDSEALAEALNEGRIAGAGIDVFEMEPPLPMDHVLLHSKNTVVAPHVAFATQEALVRRAGIAFDNIVAWMDGNPKNVML